VLRGGGPVAKGSRTKHGEGKIQGLRGRGPGGRGKHDEA